MNKRIFIYAAILIFAGFVFYLWNSSERQPEPQSAADIDSVAADNRPSISEEEEPSPQRQRLSPGTVRVRLKVDEVFLEGGTPARIVATVDTVLGYGSSTPVLGKGTEMQLAVGSYLKTNPEWGERIQEGEKIQAILFYRKGGPGQEGESGSWNLNKFVK